MSTKNAPERDFTESMKRLDTILEQFKSQTLSLEDSLKLFEEGVSHVKSCQGKLTQAKGKVEELMETLAANGDRVTRPFGDDDLD
jgi:exodeoxyribonuclease VII small subunit